MRPVDQTTFGIPRGEGFEVGNCFSACVASLLELPIEDVPTFVTCEPGDRLIWRTHFLSWLKPRGYYALTFQYNEDIHCMPEGFCILGGQSPRGSHAVVADKLTIVHDPHPSRAGLITREDFTVLIPFDPARSRP